MMGRRYRLFIAAALLAVTAAACRPAPAETRTPAAKETATAAGQAAEAATPIPTAGLPATAQPTPSATPSGAYGPTDFPEDVNPLTGLPVDDPSVLDRRPLLIKVSNESEQVRPWSGLAYADHVWEYQMEGFAQTRFTAVIYAETPERVGSVRSARLIDVEELVDMYGGILVNSGASTNRHAGGPPRINELLRAAPWVERVVNADFGFGEPYLVRIPDVPRPGIFSWHTLFAVPGAIWQWADGQGFNQRQPLDGLAFDPAPPPGGTATAELVVDYPGSGPRHAWRYDADRGAWLSWTNDVADGDTLRPEDEQLAFENVVVVYAVNYEADFIEDEPNQLPAVGQVLTGQGDAVLLRDGQRYDVTWRRDAPAQMMQFLDAGGQPVAFHPGSTFFEVVSIGIFPPDVTFAP